MTERNLKIVYCVSKKTTEAESHYHSSRLELYAIIMTLRRFRPYLLGMEFTIVTDCQASVYLTEHKSTKHQIVRWFDELQEYNFSVKYRPGTKMRHVDALSRAPVMNKITNADGGHEVLTLLTLTERMKYMQRGDQETRRIISILEKPKEDRTKYEISLTSEFKLLNGILYRSDKTVTFL